MTNTHNHTPAPWHWQIERNGMFTVQPIGVKIGITAQCAANAQLIAAAPELLEALEFAFDNCEWKYGSYEEARNKARAAIAKARGQQ